MKNTIDFLISDEVYFITDETNECYLIVGIVDRGYCYRYILGNKNGEKEVDGFEISKNRKRAKPIK